jgi:hypothetical protein
MPYPFNCQKNNFTAEDAKIFAKYAMRKIVIIDSLRSLREISELFAFIFLILLDKSQGVPGYLFISVFCDVCLV